MSTKWWRRGPVLAGGCAVVIVAVTVLTDLPQHASHSAQVAGDVSTVDAVNSSLRSCAFAVNETFTIYHDEVNHSLTASQRGEAPGLLDDDQVACSLNNNDVQNLSTLDIPGSPAAKYLEELDSTVTTWATSDAEAAIVEVRALTAHPADTSARGRLAKDVALMESDRRQAIAELDHAANAMRARMPSLEIPSVTLGG